MTIRARLYAAIDDPQLRTTDLIRDAVSEIERSPDTRIDWDAWVKFVDMIQRTADAHPETREVGRVGNVAIEGPNA
jgi:hypothetical protein